MALSNWRKWIGVEVRKPIAISELAHDRIRALADETGMPMHYWGNVAVRFFLAHVKGQRLIDAARGVTLQEYYARTGAMESLVDALLEETGSARDLQRQSQEHHVAAPPVAPAGYAKAPPAKPRAPTKAQLKARERLSPAELEIAETMSANGAHTRKRDEGAGAAAH